VWSTEGGGDVSVYEYELQRSGTAIGQYTGPGVMITFDAGTKYMTATVVYSNERETRVVRLQCEDD
jgi:hypothetical protein